MRLLESIKYHLQVSQISEIMYLDSDHGKGKCSIIFPDGYSPQEYGLREIYTIEDVDGLRLFEVIRYLEGLQIGYSLESSDAELRMLLKSKVSSTLNDD